MTDSFASSSIDSVLKMNFQAVTLLCQGAGECTSTTAASCLLRSAFEKLVSTMMVLDFDQDMKEADACGCSSSSSSFSTIETYPVSECDGYGQQQLSTLALSFSPNNAFEFYSKPFDIRCTSTDSIRRRLGSSSSNNNDTTSEHILVAATVMYNLGLTNQMLAITTGKSSHLERSVIHYQRALQLLDQVDGIHDDLSTHVLLLAICNNCGYCRSHMLDSVSTQNFQQYIKYILDNLPRPSSSSSSSYNEEQDDCFCCYCWETECDYFYSSACCFSGGGDALVLSFAPAA
jgi:hypothetical protein